MVISMARGVLNELLLENLLVYLEFCKVNLLAKE
jgi:hypothetical protein